MPEIKIDINGDSRGFEAAVGKARVAALQLEKRMNGGGRSASSGASMTSSGASSFLESASGAAITVSSAAFAASLVSAAKLGGELQDLSDITGISASGLQKWGNKANQAGSSAAAVGGSIVKMARSMESALVEPSGKTAEAFADMGVTIEDLSTSSVETVFEKVMQYLSTSKADAKTIARTLEIFGKGGAGMIGVAKTDRSATRNTDEQIANVDSLGDSFVRFKDNFVSVSIVLLSYVEKLRQKLFQEKPPEQKTQAERDAIAKAGEESAAAAADENLRKSQMTEAEDKAFEIAKKRKALETQIESQSKQTHTTTGEDFKDNPSIFYDEAFSKKLANERAGISMDSSLSESEKKARLDAVQQQEDERAAMRAANPNGTTADKNIIAEKNRLDDASARLSFDDSSTKDFLDFIDKKEKMDDELEAKRKANALAAMTDEERLAAITKERAEIKEKLVQMGSEFDNSIEHSMEMADLEKRAAELDGEIIQAGKKTPDKESAVSIKGDSRSAIGGFVGGMNPSLGFASYQKTQVVLLEQIARNTARKNGGWD